jgi:hypothetical protein
MGFGISRRDFRDAFGQSQIRFTHWAPQDLIVRGHWCFVGRHPGWHPFKAEHMQHKQEHGRLSTTPAHAASTFKMTSGLVLLPANSRVMALLPVKFRTSRTCREMT